MISLVTGIGGFVGPHLAAHLNSKGHKVFGIERSPKKVPNSAVVKCDITDAAALDNAVRDSRPGFVFHLAAISSVPQGSKDPELTGRVNVGGTRNLLSAVKKFAPKASVLVVSTAHVYGTPIRLPIDEAHPTNPISEYGQSRLEQEKVVESFRDLNVIVSRSFNHTGPGQPSGFVCSDFAKQIAGIEKGAEPVINVGDLSAQRDFTDVRDVVAAYLLAVQKCTPGIYNVCSGKAYSARQVLDLLMGMTGKRIKVIESKSRRQGDIPILVGNNSKFSSATGWKPAIPFEKTLSDLLDYWRSGAGN